MTHLTLIPGQVPLATWRDIYRGGGASIDPAAYDAIARGARAIDAILARGEPVYGINTGFGRLAGIRIDAADLTLLQRNIVLSHAAGVGEPMPRHRPPDDGAEARQPRPRRLRRASGDRRGCWRRCWRASSIPLVPSQGSVGASGDLAPLAHMAAAMIGVGDVLHRRPAMPAGTALAAVGLVPVTLAAKEGLALLNGMQFSTAYALAGLFEAERLLGPRWSPARCRPTPRAAPTRRSIRASRRCAAIAARSRWRRRCAR